MTPEERRQRTAELNAAMVDYAYAAGKYARSLERVIEDQERVINGTVYNDITGEEPYFTKGETK